MTDRINSLTVALENDVREDDIETLRSAIAQLRGVISVGLNVANSNDFVQRQRVRHELTNKIWDVLNDK